jgi:NAD(P)H-dependent FMN reductase
MPFFEEETSPSMNPDGIKNPVARAFAAKVAKADGFLIVTPEYNHAPPAVLKNALDYAYKEWNRKPVAFISYGGSAGGARAVEQLRQICIELQMVSVRSSVVIPAFWEYMNTSGQFNLGKYEQNLQRVFTELQEWLSLLHPSRV